MSDLPTGTVTFLFTDIEGSTRLLHEMGAAAYAEALAEHRRVLREAFARHGGVEVDTQGDAFFYAFATVPGAVEAAADGQRALSSGPIRVRMGVHTGTPHVGEEGYVGTDVHRAARIAAAGHGGQVLLSEATRALVDASALRDLGEHRLKDLSAPERLYQLGEAEFLPLKTLYQTNLPVQPTPLVGRQEELAEVLSLIASARLVTLTGAGGSGKTRLALQAAAELIEDYPQGVWWVSLAALRDPELVESTIAQAVGAKADLGEHLRERKALVLADNFEHLLPAAPRIAALLAEAPKLRILVTSRERLAIAAEHEYQVPSLLPAEAVALFTARARQLKPAFEPDEHVGEICARLDGLPLALELAAARVKVLKPEQILERLGTSLELLTAAGRDAPERQRTLRATIGWSYELLDEEEKELFVRLAVFAGSFDIEAAEAVCRADLDTLALLIDKCLLRQTEEGRFFMLETIREYAAERLLESGETHQLRAKHAAYFLALAEREEGFARGVEESESSRRLEADLDNLRVAHETAVLSGDADVAIRLAGALHIFWYQSCRFAEGERKATQALELDGADTARPKALGAAGELAMLQGKLETARDHFEENLNVSLELEDPTSLAKAHLLLGHLAGYEGDSADAIRHYEQTLDLIVAGAPQDAWLTRGLVLINLGWGSILAGELVDAKKYLDEALIAARTEGSHALECVVLLNLAHVALARDEVEDARERIQAAMPLLRQVPNKRLHVEALELLARALAPTEPEGAARLHGASLRLREDADVGLAEKLPHDDWLWEAKSRLGDAAWDAAEAQGHTTDDALGLASQYLDR